LKDDRLLFETLINFIKDDVVLFFKLNNKTKIKQCKDLKQYRFW